MSRTAFEELRLAELDRRGPPVAHPVALCTEVLASLLCFVPGTRAANWVGYAVGVAATTVTVILFRRRVSALQGVRDDVVYFDRRHIRWLVAALFAAGFLVAFVHIYFISQETRFA